ncbi:hypothetical protein [uncultured Pseudacidovorax sp.]|uniref:protein kinase domain-containing protein n=1 Tax=uncultured Pseudacidovorax sp. TaxID=679313 RepID=UPI0025DD191B|nr:hypothetical protein [uncultured Pseudacidovorax sp.]
MPTAEKSTTLIRKLGIETLGGRYRADYKIGDSFGGATFSGTDTVTGSKVFIKYLICPRGNGERAKFLMERDALKYLAEFRIHDVAPKLLHFEEFNEQQTLALVTDWVHGELLTTWIERSDKLSVQERLAVFHRVAFAMSNATRGYQHRDFHPGNIILLPEDSVIMGPLVKNGEATAAVKVLDWGEALPVIMGNYDDEPDHNFVMLALVPRMIAGAFTSLPPEVLRPWRQNDHFGGTYESWGLGILLYRILTLRPLSVSASLGDYALDVHNGSLAEMVKRRVRELGSLDLPGGAILPRLFQWMMEEEPSRRATIADIGRVMWDLRYEELSITSGHELEKYFSNPRNYLPTSGWRFSSIPDLD